jgi:hypothetical protein
LFVAKKKLSLPLTLCFWQGFWKRAGYVTRMPQTGYSDPCNMSDEEKEASKKFIEGAGGTWFCQWQGPKLLYNSLLDSGATFPSLYDYDLAALGISKEYYAAQSFQSLVTSNGIITSRIYELFVDVRQEEGDPLVDESNPVHPGCGPYLGGLCPVSEATKDLNNLDPFGNIIESRLSGILPFLACYVSSTPARNVLCIGEDRNDVLGAHKTPGQRRWDISSYIGQPVDRESWGVYGNPHITYSHRQATIIDTDTGPGSSRITVNGGTANEMTLEYNPRLEWQKRHPGEFPPMFGAVDKAEWPVFPLNQIEFGHLQPQGNKIPPMPNKGNKPQGGGPAGGGGAGAGGAGPSAYQNQGGGNVMMTKARGKKGKINPQFLG